MQVFGVFPSRLDHTVKLIINFIYINLRDIILYIDNYNVRVTLSLLWRHQRHVGIATTLPCVDNMTVFLCCR